MDEAFQPIFIDVAWTHDFEAEPIRLVSQLDSKRYEVRKLEFSATVALDTPMVTSRQWEPSSESCLFRL
ncbi:hypothetical protein ABIS02_41030 (plasmid) [Paraburkholderia fungorum]